MMAVMSYLYQVLHGYLTIGLHGRWGPDSKYTRVPSMGKRYREATGVWITTCIGIVNGTEVCENFS